VFVISAVGRLRQEDGEYKASLGFKVRACLKKPMKQKHIKHNLT
jgi:hypothetical protein